MNPTIWIFCGRQGIYTNGVLRITAEVVHTENWDALRKIAAYDDVLLPVQRFDYTRLPLLEKPRLTPQQVKEILGN